MIRSPFNACSYKHECRKTDDENVKLKEYIKQLEYGIELLKDFGSSVGGSSSFWDEVWEPHDTKLLEMKNEIKD